MISLKGRRSLYRSMMGRIVSFRTTSTLLMSRKTGFVDLPEHLDDELVAVAEGLGGVDEEAEQVGRLERGVDEAHHPPVEGVERLVDAGIVDEDDLALVGRLDAQDADPGRLGLVRDDGDLLAQDGVDEGGFADVRTPEEGHVADPEASCGASGTAAFFAGRFFAGPSFGAPLPVAGFFAAGFFAGAFAEAAFSAPVPFFTLAVFSLISFSMFPFLDLPGRAGPAVSLAFPDSDLLDLLLVDIEDLEGQPLDVEGLALRRAAGRACG